MKDVEGNIREFEISNFIIVLLFKYISKNQYILVPQMPYKCTWVRTSARVLRSDVSQAGGLHLFWLHGPAGI